MNTTAPSRIVPAFLGGGEAIPFAQDDGDQDGSQAMRRFRGAAVARVCVAASSEAAELAIRRAGAEGMHPYWPGDNVGPHAVAGSLVRVCSVVIICFLSGSAREQPRAGHSMPRKASVVLLILRECVSRFVQIGIYMMRRDGREGFI